MTVLFHTGSFPCYVNWVTHRSIGQVVVAPNRFGAQSRVVVDVPNSSKNSTCQFVTPSRRLRRSVNNNCIHISNLIKRSSKQGLYLKQIKLFDCFFMSNVNCPLSHCVKNHVPTLILCHKMILKKYIQLAH